MNTKKMAKRLKDSGVSPVIATILMVAITVVLAAVLYVMVSGFTHSPGTANSAGLNEAQNSAHNYTVSISSVSASNIPVSNLRLVISGGTDGSSSFSSTWTSPLTTSATHQGVAVILNILTGNSPTYLQSGDTISIGASTGWVPGSSLSGATVTLYNGNSELGSVTL